MGHMLASGSVFLRPFEAADAELYRRWRAERWMKLRHMPKAFRDNPGFVLRHAREFLQTVQHGGDRFHG